MATVQGSLLRRALDAVWMRRGDSSLIDAEAELLANLCDDDQRFVRQFARAVSQGEIKAWSPDSGGVSTRNLALLPDIVDLRRLCQSIAMLEAIISPEWESRYYSFSRDWAPGAMCASMRNGSGDDFFIHFSEAGALIKGFAHEYPMSPWSRITRSYHGGEPGLWPGITQQVPSTFADALNEPAFDWEATTFCIWRTHDDPEWKIGDIDFPKYDYWVNFQKEIEVGEVQDPDGSSFLLSILDGDPRTYKAWADRYYWREDGPSRGFSLSAIQRVYERQPLTKKLVRQLNPETTLESLEAEIRDIGYPS